MKTDEPNTVFFDSGDFLSINSSINDDEIVAGVYPEMGYDASAVGDQELINGISFFKNKLNGKLSFVASNLVFTDPDIKPEKYKIVTTENGTRIGVTGLNFNTGFKYLMRTGTVNENEITVEKAFDSLRSVLQEMKDKSDIIVVLAHLNREGMVKLIDYVDGYDVLIGGHNDEEFIYPRIINDKVYVQNGRDGEKIGKIVFTERDDGRMTFKDYELIKISAKKFSRNKHIEEIISSIQE